jgi:site-specific recombinase XerD
VVEMIADAGDRAARRFLDFFAASIENDNTRMAYYRAACSFFAWLEQHGIGELADIEPFHVAAYIKALKVSEAGKRAVQERAAARPTVKAAPGGDPHAVRLAHRRPISTISAQSCRSR